MPSPITFSPMPGSTGYRVHDRTATPHPEPGYVIRAGRGTRSWVAVPTFEMPVTARTAHPQRIFTTRREAAFALTRFADTYDPAWLHVMTYA